MQRWQEAVLPPWLIGVGLVGGLLAFPAQRRRVAGVASVFFLAQLLFPFAYAYQDYYFYACAVFLLAGFGFVLHGLLDSRLPRWLCWLLVAVLPAAQLQTYWRGYYEQQMIPSNGGFAFTEALRDFTPRETVIIVVGGDWAAIIPLYSQRRALMIRNGLQYDRAYVTRAFAELGDEAVSALVLVREQRTNALIRDLAVATFDLESTPTFSHATADIYCGRRYSNQVKQGLKERQYYGNALVAAPPSAPPVDAGKFWVTRNLARSSFGNVSPAPIQARFAYGLNLIHYGGKTALSAHPDSDLWLHAPAHATRIEWDYAMISAAWNREGGKSDGVELAITGLLPGGARRVLFQRWLDPTNQPKDRGLQRENIPYQAVPGELLQFSSRPGKTYSYDWHYWERIEVK